MSKFLIELKNRLSQEAPKFQKKLISFGKWLLATGLALIALPAGYEALVPNAGIEKVFNFYNDMIANNPTNTLHPNTDMHVIMALKIKKYLENQEIYSIWQ